MVLRVGMYVRSEDYGIGKVISICTCEECEKRGFYEPTIEFADFTDYVTSYNYMKIYEDKASYKPIELLQVGDYVNGILIESVDKFEDGTISLNSEPINFCKVETIVTKEQFKSMEYRIGE